MASLPGANTSLEEDDFIGDGSEQHPMQFSATTVLKSTIIDNSHTDNRPTANGNTDNSSLGSVSTTICKRYLSDETSHHQSEAKTSAAGPKSIRQLGVHPDSEKRSEIIHEEVMEDQDMSELGLDANLDSVSKMASVPKLDNTHHALSNPVSQAGNSQALHPGQGHKKEYKCTEHTNPIKNNIMGESSDSLASAAKNSMFNELDRTEETIPRFAQAAFGRTSKVTLDRGSSSANAKVKDSVESSIGDDNEMSDASTSPQLKNFDSSITMDDDSPAASFGSTALEGSVSTEAAQALKKFAQGSEHSTKLPMAGSQDHEDEEKSISKLSAALSNTSDDDTKGTNTGVDEATPLRGVRKMNSSSSEMELSNEGGDWYANIKERAARSNIGNELPGPGWRRNVVHNKNRNYTFWVSPRRNIEFDTKAAAFLFQEFCNAFPDEYKALPKYRQWRKGLGEHPRIRNLKQYDEGTVSENSSRGARKSPPEDEFYANVKGRAKEKWDSSIEVPGPGWTMSTFLSGDHNRNLYVAPALSIIDADKANQRKVGFDSRPAAFLFEEFRTTFSDGHNALQKYKEWGKRVGQRLGLRGSSVDTRKEDGSTSKVSSSANDDDDVGECWYCRKTGFLIICDDCGEPWHLHCNTPRLEKVPEGSFSCQECVAKTMTRMQRCGECQDCTRPDCGECKACVSKKKFGGDGRYGRACKEKKCKNMRYAAPEKMASVVRPTVSSKRVTKQAPKKKSQVTTKKIAEAAARYDKKASSIKASKSIIKDEQHARQRTLLGPGWKSIFVQEYGVNCHHWISPRRKIEFTRWSAAFEFEELRKKFGNNEYHAWEQYRIAKKGGNHRVISASQYDVDVVAMKRSAKKESTIKTSKLIIKDNQHARQRPLPGPGWKSIFVQEYGVNCHHWISPRRKIEFRRWSVACEFEELRKKFGNNEYHAWEQYRRKGGDSRVISATQYDVNPTTAAGKSKESGNSGRVAKSTVSSKQATKHLSSSAAKKIVVVAKRSAQKPSNIKTPKSIIGTEAEKHRPSAKPSQATRKAGPTTKKRKTPASNDTPTSTPMIASPFKNNTPNDDGGLECSNIKIVCLVEQPKKVSFFQKRFENRILLVEKSLSNTTHPQKVITHNNKRYSLASSKVVKDKKGGPFMFMSDNKIELVYVQVSRDLQKELEKLCSFSTERPEKIVARLGNFQAEAKNINYYDCSNIEIIEAAIDSGGGKYDEYEGCGFYPEGFFTGSKKYDAMQVRIVAPTIGLAKGMLLKKKGIDKIQLPQSMIKVGPSQTCKDPWAAVIIKNVFPSEENKQMGRYLDPDSTAIKSWVNPSPEKGRKPLKPMYQRLIVGYGVDSAIVDKYAKQSIRPDKLRHAHIKGVIDPTGKIPENKVFVSGYVSHNGYRELFGKAHKSVYLSRSPCLEPGDAKLVNVLGSKPEGMTSSDWSMLCDYGFGTIVFPRPRNSRSKHLACMIADGDLDGDDYFVLWEERILDSLLHSKKSLVLKSRKILRSLQPPSGMQQSGVDKTSKHPHHHDARWLSKAQNFMIDFPSRLAAKQIVGKLWGLCLKASERDDGTIDIFDEDAISYAKAYKDALDVQKHGGKIALPQHLHANLKSSAHRELLTSI